jgi:hypothetical protein
LGFAHEAIYPYNEASGRTPPSRSVRTFSAEVDASSARKMRQSNNLKHFHDSLNHENALSGARSMGDGLRANSQA